MPEENPPQQNLEDLKMRVDAIEDKLRKIYISAEELRALNVTDEELKAYHKVAAALGQRTSGPILGTGLPVPYLIVWGCGGCFRTSYGSGSGPIGFGSLGS
jgi:hypothetical protein